MPDNRSDTALGVTLDDTTEDSGSGTQVESGGQSDPSESSPKGSKDDGGNAKAWYEALSDAAAKEYAAKKGWKSVDEAVKSYQNLETELSKRSKEAGPKPPEKPEQYEFKKPEKLADGLDYSDKFVSWLKKAAHKAGLSNESASAMHDALLEYGAQMVSEQRQAMQEALQEAVTKATKELTQDWGDMESPKFQRNLELAKRAIRMADPNLKTALKEIGAVTEIDGKLTITNATLFKALARMGEGMYAEDKTFGDPTAGGRNPFDDKTFDLAMQGRLVKEDPERAIALIKAAGKEAKYRSLIEAHARNRKR